MIGEFLLTARKFVGAVMVDLSKAFDTINHRLLIEKLHSYGISGTELKWFSNYLSQRKQRAVLNGVRAAWSNVRAGVPQGSILGPLLFILFVNDLPSVVRHSEVNLYADDTTVYVADVDPIVVRDKLTEDLNAVACWIDNNGLRMNVSKTNLLVLSPKRKHPCSRSNSQYEERTACATG